MVAYAYRMPAGIPGEVTRYSVGTTIEQQLVDPNAPPPSYGIPVVIDAVTHGVRGLIATDTPAAFNMPYGCVVRPYPIQPSAAANYGASPVGTPGVPPTQGIVDILKRGYMSVSVVWATTPPLKGAPVYIWTAASAGVQVQGGFTSDSAPAGSVVAAPAYFTGPADSAGNGEIAWNI